MPRRSAGAAQSEAHRLERREKVVHPVVEFVVGDIERRHARFAMLAPFARGLQALVVVHEVLGQQARLRLREGNRHPVVAEQVGRRPEAAPCREVRARRRDAPSAIARHESLCVGEAAHMNAVPSQPVGHSRRVTMAGEAEERRAAQDFAAGRDQEFVEPLAIRRETRGCGLQLEAIRRAGS